MDKKTKILELYQEGKSADEIVEELKSAPSYVWQVINDFQYSKKIGTENIYKKLEENRAEMTRKEKIMKTLIPFKDDDAKDFFHELEKDVLRLRTERHYFERKISKYETSLK